MIKDEYLQIENVWRFSDWLADKFNDLRVNLRIRSSRFVPGGLDEMVHGIEAVVEQYRWDGDWTITRNKTDLLSDRLRDAVEAADDISALAACDKIFEWGGDRNPLVGARPFLMAKAEAGTLSLYLKSCKMQLALASANIAHLDPAFEPLSSVKRMNSMLTKVHAFLSRDGLPIYDSRVAAAIAALVTMYQKESESTWEEVPAELTFPAVSRMRTANHYLLEALDHGVLNYEKTSDGGASESTLRWTHAKVRLGWVLGDVLKKNPRLFVKEGNDAARMHALEAGLFMIGYNVAALLDVEHATSPQPKTGRRTRKSAGLDVQAVEKCVTLGKAKRFNFAIHNGGFVIEYKVQRLHFEAEDVADMLREFSGECGVPLGANRTPPDEQRRSFGQWLAQRSLDTGPRLTPQHASRVAAVLKERFGVTARLNGNQIVLDFP